MIHVPEAVRISKAIVKHMLLAEVHGDARFTAAGEAVIEAIDRFVRICESRPYSSGDEGFPAVKPKEQA